MREEGETIVEHCMREMLVIIIELKHNI